MLKYQYVKVNYSINNMGRLIPPFSYAINQPLISTITQQHSLICKNEYRIKK